MSKIEKLIARIVEKKNGVKLTDVYSYLKGKAEELEIEVSLQICKEAAAKLFTEQKIDLVEYRLPGENEKARMFLLPVGCTVVHGEDAPDEGSDEDQIFAEMANSSEEPMLLSSDMFETFHVVEANSFLATPSAEQAQATYLKLLGEGKEPRLFGAIPVSMSVSISYTPPVPTLGTEENVSEDTAQGAPAVMPAAG